MSRISARVKNVAILFLNISDVINVPSNMVSAGRMEPDCRIGLVWTRQTLLHNLSNSVPESGYIWGTYCVCVKNVAIVFVNISDMIWVAV